jgi:hypothetical protein
VGECDFGGEEEEEDLERVSVGQEEVLARSQR